MKGHYLMNNRSSLNILHIDSSSRYNGSSSRSLSRYFIDQISEKQENATITQRDLGQGLPLITEDWVNANFTPEDQQNPDQRQILQLSDHLVQEIIEADVIVMGLPMYNFAIPAALKAWIDLIVRARKTFHYTANGPEGLVTGKKAYIIATTGGTPIGSDADFATSYIKFILAFIGISDIEIIAADSLMADMEEKIAEARLNIETTANNLFAAA